MNIIRCSVQYARTPPPPNMDLKVVKKCKVRCIIRIEKVDQTVILIIKREVKHAQFHHRNTLPDIRKTR